MDQHCTTTHMRDIKYVCTHNSFQGGKGPCKAISYLESKKKFIQCIIESAST